MPKIHVKRTITQYVRFTDKIEKASGKTNYIHF